VVRSAFASVVLAAYLYRMAKFFASNIGRTGRIIRGSMSLAFLVAAIWFLRTNPWVSLLFFMACAFTGFEALRGWCVMRACGVKTKY
jgi:hypothetical protein